MPRTTTVECPGCPPLRALTFDALGLIKVIEARSKEGGAPKVVDRWGDPDASRCVLAASIDDHQTDPLLSVARKNGVIELLNPLNGNLRLAIPKTSGPNVRPEDDPIVGLHLFRRHRLEPESRSCTLLTCTTKGQASLRSVEFTNSPADSGLSKSWKVCGSGEILCFDVDSGEKNALFGGKGVEVNVWDIDSGSKIWNAKPPPKNSLGIFTPAWFTSATFLRKDDHRKFVAGTNCHQVRLYDISAQRRPVLTFDFREAAIKAVAEGLDGHTIYVGNGSGDLASVDIRTGKLTGCFLGKCSGSIRSIVKHPEHPVLASCGLDSYVRFWDINSRQLLSAYAWDLLSILIKPLAVITIHCSSMMTVFLKQHLNKVVFDACFTEAAAAPPPEEPSTNDVQIENETGKLPAKRKKSSKNKGSKRKVSRVKGEAS